MNDIAITCGLNPSSLGVDADETGKIYLGSRIGIRICRIVNVFAKSQVRKSLVSDETIPSRVVDVTSTRTRVRAVVVVEHRNLATAMMWLKEGFDDVLIVMV